MLKGMRASTHCLGLALGQACFFAAIWCEFSAAIDDCVAAWGSPLRLAWVKGVTVHVADALAASTYTSFVAPTITLNPANPAVAGRTVLSTLFDRALPTFAPVVDALLVAPIRPFDARLNTPALMLFTAPSLIAATRKRLALVAAAFVATALVTAALVTAALIADALFADVLVTPTCMRLTFVAVAIVATIHVGPALVTTLVAASIVAALIIVASVVAAARVKPALVAHGIVQVAFDAPLRIAAALASPTLLTPPRFALMINTTAVNAPRARLAHAIRSTFIAPIPVATTLVPPNVLVTISLIVVSIRTIAARFVSELIADAPVLVNCGLALTSCSRARPVVSHELGGLALCAPACAKNRRGTCAAKALAAGRLS